MARGRGVSGLAGAVHDLWRFRVNVSPLLAQPEPPAGDEAPCLRGARRQLQLEAPAAVPAEPPRGHGRCDVHHAQVAVEKHDVDGEAHADRVDAAQRVGQQQPGAGCEPVTPQQAARRPGAERAHHLDRPEQGLAGCRIDDLDHAASVPATRVRRTTRRSAVRVRTRARPHRERCGPGPLRSLRYAPRMLSEDFHSGDDVTLGFLGRTYGFARSDFEQRVLRAAVELELVRRPLSRAERDDLVAAAINGRLDAPRSEAGERLAELQTRGGEDPVYWLRKLVFRSAWLDHRIKEGAIDIAYDDAAGAFRIEPGRYPLPGSGHPSFAVTEAAA
jgi:hypothetical protein